MYDDPNILVDRAIRYLELDGRVAMLPISTQTRREITRTYILGRAKGLTHKEAKAETLKNYSVAWITVAWIVLQIIFAILQHFWETRHA